MCGISPSLCISILSLLCSCGSASLLLGQDSTASISFINEDPRLDAIGDSLPPQALMRFGTERFQHPSSVTAMALSPDEEVVVTLDSGFVIGWEAATGKEKWRRPWQEIGGHIMGPAYGQQFLSFGRGKNFYTPGVGNTIYRWNAHTGEAAKVQLELPLNPLRILNPRRGGAGFTSVDSMEDEQQILAGGPDGLHLIDLKDGKQLWFKTNKPKADLEDVAPIQGIGRDRLAFGGEFTIGQFSPDEQTIASVMSQDPQKLVLRESATGKELAEIELESRMIRMCFSLDGKSIFTTERDCGIRRYSLESQELEWELKLDRDPQGAESYTSAIDLSPDGQLIAAGAPIGPKYWIYLVDAESGKEVSILKSDMWKPWAVRFTRDSQTLFSTGWDASIRRWDVATGTELPLPVGMRATSQITISPNGKWIAIRDGEGQVRIVDRASGTQMQRIKLKSANAEALRFSADSQVLFVGGGQEEHVAVESWQISDEPQDAPIQIWKWPKGDDPHSGIEELALSPDGQFLAAASFRQDKAYLWDIRSGKKVFEFPHNDVYGLSFSQDSSVLATAGWDNMLRLWNVETGEAFSQTNVTEQVVTDEGGRADLRMYTVSCSPGGQQLALAHMSGFISVWNIENPEHPKALRHFKARWFTFGALDFSPDGVWLAAGDSGGGVHVHNAHTAETMLYVGTHPDHVYTVRFGAESRQLVSGGGGVSYLWSLDAKDELADQSLEELWETLGDKSATERFVQTGTMNNAFGAMQLLSQTDEGLEYLFQRLKRIENVLEPAKITAGLEGTAAERRLALIEKAADEDEAVELEHVVRRALSAMRSANDDQAIANLEYLAQEHSHTLIREFASELIGR